MRELTPLSPWEVGQQSSEVVPGISQPHLVMQTETDQRVHCVPSVSMKVSCCVTGIARCKQRC